jgi:hypothetical protein
MISDFDAWCARLRSLTPPKNRSEGFEFVKAIEEADGEVPEGVTAELMKTIRPDVDTSLLQSVYRILEGSPVGIYYRCFLARLGEIDDAKGLATSFAAHPRGRLGSQDIRQLLNVLEGAPAERRRLFLSLICDPSFVADNPWARGVCNKYDDEV